MQSIPLFVKIIFFLTTLLTIFIFYKSGRQAGTPVIVVLVWCLIQSIVGLTGFYTDTSTIPPRFLLLVGPPVVLIAVLFFTSRGKKYLDSLDLKTLSLLHIVRIPVEMVLYWLFVYKAVPELMTFEGRNFDILSGITAPLVYYFGFVRKSLPNWSIIIWNLICLALLINIVASAILSAPTPFQKFAFDQPNIGVFFFPFNLLPACVVPLVFMSHLVSIRQLMEKKPINH